MSQMRKKRYIREIYSSAKREWKRNNKQKVVEFYIKRELEKELKEDLAGYRYFELKVYCNELSNIDDLSIMIAVLSVFMGISDTEKNIIWVIVMLAIIAIFAVYPFKKCKFVLDNMTVQEVEKIMAKQDNLDKQDNINDLIEKIEDLKQKWLNKEVSLLEVGDASLVLVNKLKEEPDYYKVKKYIENKLLLDKNIVASETLITNTTLTFIPILITINSLFLKLNEGVTWVYNILYMGIALLILIGAGILCYSIIKKHIGKYAREKSFYEIVKNTMSE